MSGRYSSTPTEARTPSPPLDYLVDWHGDASPPKAPVLSTDMMELSAPWNKTWSTAPASEEKSEEWFAFQPEKPRSPTQAARNTRPDITTLEDRTPANPVPLRPENLLEKTIHIIPSAAQKVDKKSYLGLAAAVTPATPPARVTAPAAQTQDTANMLTEDVVRPPVSADNDQPPLWKNLTTRKEPGQVLENLGNGQWRVLLGEGETQRKMVFNDAQVAAMTGMFKPELEVFKAKNPPQKMAPTAEVPAAAAPQSSPATRADRPFGELDAEVARVAGKNRREYPRTAEQAIANFRADGQELTDREASMIYSKFSQEYPGLNKIPRVEPTPQVPLPESFNDTRPQMRAATPKEIDSWGLRKSLAQPTSPYGLGFGEPELPVTPPSQDNPPRLTWNNQYDRISNTSEQKLKVEGQWRVEDIPAFLKDPSLMHVTPAERQQLLNDVLRAAGEDYAKRKGYSRENFVAYQTFADHLRKEVSGLTTAGDHTEGLVNGVGEVSTGILRGTIAKAADGTMLEPEFGSDPSVENLRVPFGTVARQAGYWGQKGMDTVDTLWASGKGHDLEEGLADLEKDLAEGNLPFGDRDAFEAWIKKHSQQISQGQSTWYEAAQGTSAKINKKDGKEEVMDGDWLQGYARSNSLEAPQNASLLAEFIRTRDPAVWAQLTDNLKKTPRRAGIERDQQEHLENSSVVRFLTDSMGTVDYKEAMKQAGNPLDLASDFIPIVRGARMVSSGAKAASRGGKVVAGIKSVAGSLASDLAIDSLNQAVENPNSTLEDYLATGRDTVATALGLHAVGMAAGKVGQMLPQETKPPLPNGAQPAPHPTPPETARQPASSAQPAPPEPAPPSGAEPMPPGMNEGQIEAMPSEINPQVISEAPGAAPVAPPPAGPISIQEKLQQLHEQAASQGLAPEIHEVDGKFIVKDAEGNPATFDYREEAVQAAFVFMTPEQRQKVGELAKNVGHSSKNGSTSRLQFSQAPQAESDVVKVHQNIAEAEDAFRYGKTKPDIKGNPMENDWRDSLEVLSEAYSVNESPLTIGEDYPSYPGGYGFNIETKDGSAFVAVDRVLGTVFVNTAGMKSSKAGAGSQVYQMVSTFAKNNGLTFMPDGTVSSIAQHRRLSHMISSALRHGSTKHFDGLLTFEDKKTGMIKTEVPGWKPGDDNHNLALLLKMEHDFVMEAAKAKGMDLSHLTHDPATDTILDGHTGTPLTRSAVNSLVDRLEPGVSGVGKTTLLRALVTGSTLQRSATGGGVSTLRSDAGGHTGGAASGGSNGELVSVARHLYYSRPPEGAGGLPERRVGDTLSGGADGLAAAIAETTRVLNEKQPGLVNERTHFFTTVDELLGSDYARERGYTAEDMAGIRTAEGFHDPETGDSVIVAENTRLLEGESPQQAIARVVLHERVSHDGLNLLLGRPDSARSRRWAALSEQIPQAELDAIAGEKGYQHLAGRRNDLAFEWLARRTETDFSLLEKGSLPQRMWDEFRELVMDMLASVGGKPTMGRSFEQQVQDLKIRARNAAMKPVKTHR